MGLVFLCCHTKGLQFQKVLVVKYYCTYNIVLRTRGIIRDILVFILAVTLLRRTWLSKVEKIFDDQGESLLNFSQAHQHSILNAAVIFLYGMCGLIMLFSLLDHVFTVHGGRPLHRCRNP